MRVANLNGRLVLLDGDRALDVATASSGAFGPDPQTAYVSWESFAGWARGADFAQAVPFDAAQLGPPVPAPSQVIAIGLNYREHAIESNLAIPDAPVVFSKFASCLTGPVGDIPLVPGNVDWEAELVVVIGRSARGISVADAWSHVAGFTIGQDISERVLQTSGPAPQFGLAKSFESFGPTGPAVVTVDELDDPDDLAIGSSLDGEVMQDSRTSELIFPVAELVSRLSHVLELRGGDLIFTGTPSGVGMGRKPPRFARAGQELRTRIEGLGEMRHRFVAVASPNGV
jgi:2,4-didehydro-3-deoxy-L-rhamnonate hydrolase